MEEKLYYKVIGEGKPLICLHGYALDHTIWLEMAEMMKSKVKLILPDLLGHGKSPAPEGVYTMDRLAKCVINVMDDLEINQAFVAGHSMGGYVALELVKNHLNRISGLTMIASHAYEDSEKIRETRYEDIDKLKSMAPATILEDMPEKLSKNPRVAEFCRSINGKMKERGMAGILAGMAERPNSIDVLNKAGIPVMAIAGTDDQYIPLKTFKAMCLETPHLLLTEISNAGHMPMMEKPHDTAQAILNIFDN